MRGQGSRHDSARRGSDDQELYETDRARRGFRDRKRHCGEGHTSEIDGERMREVPWQKQEYRWQEERQEAEVHEHRVIVHTVLALTEAAQTGGEDEQSQGGYRRPTPPPLQEVTLSHGMPQSKHTARAVPQELPWNPLRKPPERLAGHCLPPLAVEPAVWRFGPTMGSCRPIRLGAPQRTASMAGPPQGHHPVQRRRGFSGVRIQA